MQELLAQLLLVLRGASRYRWPALALAWVVALTGWIIVATIPDQFEARTVVGINNESLLTPLLKDIAVDRDARQVSTMESIVKTRENLLQVAHEADLLLGASSAREQELVVEELRDRISVIPTGSSAATRRRNDQAIEYTITYVDSSPKTAYEVVRAVLDVFMERSLGRSRSDAGVAQQFLRTQLNEYEKKLRDAETKLAEFKKANIGLIPGQADQDYYGRLDAAMTTLSDLRAKYRQVGERRNELQRQIDGEEPTFGLSGPVSGDPIDAQIAGYQARIDELLVQYTEKHPEVVAMRDTIARLQEEKRAGARVSSTVAPPGGGATSSEDLLIRNLDMNPVYQNLRISLSQADAELAELRGQIGAQEQMVGTLRGRVDAIPEVEAELMRLNRDSKVNRDQYNALLERLEQARISEQADQSGDDVELQVFDRPVEPVTPSGPQRAMLNTVVMLMSLAAGLALALFLQQVRPVFSTKDAVRQVTGLPVIGSVSAAIATGFVPWYRRQSALLGGALLALFAVFLLNLMLQDSVRAAGRGIVG
jgi:polysaccharide chain length determinant protein (PEP-CTERM system associated)